MGRTGVAVDAAMFAALVGVDGPVETDVRTGVPRDDRPGVFGRQGRAQRRSLGVVGRPAVIEGLHGFRLEPARRIRSSPPSFRRVSHEVKIATKQNKARTISTMKRPAVQGGPSWPQAVSRRAASIGSK